MISSSPGSIVISAGGMAVVVALRLKAGNVTPKRVFISGFFNGFPDYSGTQAYPVSVDTGLFISVIFGLIMTAPVQPGMFYYL
jgi:hypothetical protein